MVAPRPGIGYWTWTNPGGIPPIPPVVDDGSAGPLARRLTLAEINAMLGMRRLTPAELAILLVILADE